MINTTLPATPGVGFKPDHFGAIMAGASGLGFLEIHAENYLGAGGAPHAMLAALAERHAISVHGVGLSIGGDALDARHLARVRALCDRIRPASFSEHLAWSSHGGEYLNDLLPLPYTDATLDRVCGHVAAVQDALGRQMLLENPATYVTFADSTIPEPDFLGAIVARTGCGLLLDVNNVFVSGVNHRGDPRAWLAAAPLDAVGEIHLGGHAEVTLPDGTPLLIDDHGHAVADPVWALLDDVLARTGPLPVLVEWDTDVPAWPVLQAEAARAASALDHARARHARVA